VNKTNFGVKLV